MIKGVDVSSFQSTTYSLTGLDFVFVKATQSTNYVNPHMPAQVQRARNAGVVVGMYHFLVRGNIKAQAAYFVAKAGARPGEILACDWEANTDGTFPSNAEKDEFLAEVKRLAPKHRVVLYCNRDYWLNHDRTSVCGDGLWIADYSHPAGHPAIKHAWLFNQYSAANNTDSDVGNFSTRAALKQWAGYPPATK
ncbi:glycoside hydrolase family 25 protein [Actinacidiphila acididurans]|uniref:Muramidase n=1 Tax=Actinacidiphila acididurans TaxID=2784346 RepID=A0ABS2TMF1_9ACTN|nr:GH25 family lysozyme [Actinacidiphila acididurans]MBM9504516.1 muramidase [Actinacidiphila acididurans]